LLFVHILNSYLIFLANNETIDVVIYYFLNFINLLLSIFIMYSAIK